MTLAIEFESDPQKKTKHLNKNVKDSKKKVK